MPYDGYMTYAGTELFNVPRTTAYLRNILPSVQVEDTCGEECTCDHLPALLGHVEYNNPFIDDAPWVDLDRPESFDFLGFYPTEIVGLTDDTTRATVEERVGNGGWITDTRRASREVYVNGVLIASSMEGAHYGETWLKAMMEGSCDDSCGIPTDTLCFLTACVDPADFGGTRVRKRFDVAEFRAFNGAHWNGDALIFPTMAAYVDIFLPSTVCGPVEWELDLDIIKGGENLLVDYDGYTDAHYVRTGQELIKVTTQGTRIRLHAAPTTSFLQTPTGGAQWTPQPGAGLVSAAYWEDHPYGDGNAEWWGTLSASTSVDLHVAFDGVTAIYRDPTSDEDCKNDLLRYIPEAIRIEGPIFGREEHLASGAVLRNVSFIMGSQSPHIYGERREVVSAPMPSARFSTLPEVIGPCTESLKGSGLIHDPQRPEIPKPPYPPQQPDQLREKTQDTLSNPYAIVIPDFDVANWQSSVPILEVSTQGNDARFISVAFYPLPLDSTTVRDVDPCSACGKFEIAYIPQDATFVADATTGHAYVKRTGYEDVLADTLLTSETGVGRATWPELSCRSSYMMVVQTYGQKLAEVRLSLAVRE